MRFHFIHELVYQQGCIQNHQSSLCALALSHSRQASGPPMRRPDLYQALLLVSRSSLRTLNPKPNESMQRYPRLHNGKVRPVACSVLEGIGDRPDHGWYEKMTGASSQMDCSTREGVVLGKFRNCSVYKERHILEGQENMIMIHQTVREGLW